MASWLDRHPNMYVDIDARISELGRQPYSARKFLIKYQDRVLFGTDTTPSARAYRMYFRFLETDDEYFDPAGGHHRQGFWMIYGVFLPDDVLAKLYNGNARKVLFGLPAEKAEPLDQGVRHHASRTPLRPTSLPRTSATATCWCRGMFDDEEIGLLLRSAKEDRALDEHSYGKDDGEGGRVRLSLWNHPGDGIYGMFARCRRMVDACEQILDDEVYHYHSKMIMKDAKVGGAWTWHQDYGYWYQNGVLFPDLVQRLHRRRSSHQGERLPAGHPGLAPAGPDRPRPDRPAGRGRHGPGRGDPQAAAAGARRDATRRRPLLPPQPAAPLRPQYVREPALEHDLLLQRPPQRPVQGGPPPAVHAAVEGRRPA